MLGEFPSAISRYLVSNAAFSNPPSGEGAAGFHPLYRGTWFPTVFRPTLPNVWWSFHPLYRGTWFPTLRKSGRQTDPRGGFPSAISRYLVSNPHIKRQARLTMRQFPSAISRYLVSNRLLRSMTASPLYGFHPLYRGTWFPTGACTAPRSSTAVSIRYIAVLGFQPIRQRPDVPSGACFHPLYRGTWFPTSRPGSGRTSRSSIVSIRYIAVLGFQPYQKNTPSDQRRRKRFTHPPSNRSHSHICFLKSR